MSRYLIAISTPGFRTAWSANKEWISTRDSAEIYESRDDAEWVAAALAKNCPTSTIEIIEEETC